MKYKNLRERYGSLNLQIFAEAEPEENESGSGGDDSDEEENGENPEERKFTQEDMDNAIKERLRREKRKWQREQQRKLSDEPNGGGKTGDDEDENDNVETKELKKKAKRVDELELKWVCLEHDCDKSCVDDVLALAKVHVVKNPDMDVEDAIDEVLEKYPNFKTITKLEDGEGQKTKSWGQRQRGRNKSIGGVEAAFLKKNPGLKID